MSIRTSPWPAGTPCWADMSVPDVPATSAFYYRTFHHAGGAFVQVIEADQTA